ncbi:MAG: hypothetical protein LBV41_02410 [Cytophagaceae bacterium]|jgi:hypothetical protein|nr:hypothetical protein [Cytophagaceae bacterium]
MIGNLAEIREKGYKALSKELGAAGTVVFLRQFESGNGNYTEEREELLKDLTIDNIVASIEKRKNEQIANKEY